MAPREGDPLSGDVSSFKLTAYKKFPTNYPHRTLEQWLSGKRADDDIGPYWRVHNKLYDLTDFIDKHPGGRTWLQVTKGTDITEAFESAHIGEGSEKLLQKYYVKDIKTPRNSPYTFHENGFYKTLKRKVRPILKKTGQGPSWKSVLIQDGLALAFVLLAFAATVLSSYSLAVFAGIVLALTAICAHNYFHQRDNWRMYYFDLSCLSSHEWRVSHALSHHLYTNTANDMEISLVEPFLEFLPKPDKTFIQRYAAYVYELAVIAAFSFVSTLTRMYEVWTGKTPLRPEYFITYFELLVMSVISSSFWMALKLFLTIHVTCNIVFMSIGLTAAHHHPDIFHDGDRMRDNPDWGLCQLDAVRERFLFLIMSRKCKNDPNRFCYVCGCVTMTGRQCTITPLVKNLYHAYFGMKLEDQDKALAPHMCCKTCVENLRRWSNKKSQCLPFGIPMVWREGRDHTTDCYFCMTNLQGINRKNKHHVKYPDYTKFPCFLCQWDSRADKQHYIKRDWPARNELAPGSHNVVAHALVNPHNILLPPLHIKLGVFKNFVKALDKKSQAFNILKEKFPKVSEAKVNAGIFDDPQIRQLFKDPKFDCSMDVNEKKAWYAFKSIASNFLGIYRSQEYERIDEDRLLS